MRKLIIFTVITLMCVVGAANAELLTNYTQADGGLISNEINAIAMDPSGSIWVGTDKGISRFNGLEWQSYRQSNANMPSEYINCIMPDNDGNIYFGTAAGVTRFDDPRWEALTIALPSPNVTSIALDSFADIWFATDGGIAKFQNEKIVTTFSQANSSIIGDFIKQIVIDSYEYFWLATVYGVSRFDGQLDDPTFDNFTTVHNLPDDYVYSIAVEQGEFDDIIWVATPGGVGKRVNDSWSVILASEGELLDDHVRYVVVDYQLNKWFATFEGVSEYTSAGIWVNYTEENGLVDNECKTLFVDSSENVWVGTKNGITKIGSNPTVTFDMILYLNIDTKAFVTVNDPNSNTDDTAIETVTANILSSLDPNGIALTLTETSAASGIFSSNQEGEELLFSYNATNEEERRILVEKGGFITAYYTQGDGETVRKATAYYNEIAPFSDTLFLDCFIAQASYDNDARPHETPLYNFLDSITGIAGWILP